MKVRILLQGSIIGVSLALLMIVNRPIVRYLSHPYRAPEFELPDLNGDQVHLSDFRGKAVVLNFWASWCAPCRREIPWFIEFQKKYGPRGLQIIGVSMDEGGKDAIAPFVRRTGIDYDVLLGDSHVSSLYGGLQILPTTYYIAPDGNVRAFAKGVVSRTELEQQIKKLLRSPAVTTEGGDSAPIPARIVPQLSSMFVSASAGSLSEGAIRNTQRVSNVGGGRRRRASRRADGRARPEGRTRHQERQHAAIDSTGPAVWRGSRF